MRSKNSKKHVLTCKIQEHYKSAPAINARKIVERLLLSVSPKHLEGLGSVILCDTASFKENYGENEKLSTARYVSSKKGEYLPFIEICIDILFARFPISVLKISFISDLILSVPLYHELGHHIQMISVPIGQEPEAAAEKWRKKLQKQYFLRKYWYIVIFLLIFLLPFKRQMENYCRTNMSNTK